jgi:hypothetical protein
MFEDLISGFFFVVVSKKFLQRMDEGSRTWSDENAI